MELNQFIELFAAQFSETDPRQITPETKFKELDEWSSLLAITVIVLADDEFDVVLKGDDIRNATTVEDLYNVIKSRT